MQKDPRSSPPSTSLFLHRKRQSVLLGRVQDHANHKANPILNLVYIYIYIYIYISAFLAYPTVPNLFTLFFLLFTKLPPFPFFIISLVISFS